MHAAPRQPSADGRKSAPELIASPEFRALVRKRWSVSFGLLAVLCAGYFGYLLVVAGGGEWVSRRMSDAPDAVATIAVVLGVATILGAWVLTAVYVWWANTAYDPEVERLKRQLRR
jgi:uncharacterized membrane protein (DUF485 family)